MKHLNFLSKSRWLLVPLMLLTLGIGQMWGTDPVASATAADGNEYVVAIYYNSKYYALPNNTSASTWAGTEVEVNGSGYVTTENAPTWKLVEGSTSGQYYLTYKNGNSTYYLYKNGTSASNYNIKGSTSSSERNYWSFTAGTGANAGKYQVLAVGRGTNHTCLGTNNNSTFQVRNTSGYNIILLELAPAVAYTVTLMDDNSTRTEASPGAGVTLPTRSGCDGYTFAGWTASWTSAQTSWTTIAPTIIPAGAYAPSANINLYPVYTKSEGSTTTWNKVTSAPSDWSGDYVIVNPDGNAAMISDLKSGSNEFLSEAVTINQAGTQLTSTPSNKAIWIVAKNGDNAQYSFKNKSTGTYAKITGTSSTNAALDANAVWFTIESTGTNYVWDIASVTNSARCFAWYGTNSSFRTYAKNSNNTGYLYKKSGGSITYYKSVPNCCDPLASINGSVF